MKWSRLIINAMLICITLTFFCSKYIPKALVIQIIVFAASGLTASLMCITGNRSKYKSVVYLCIWMLVKQIQYNISYTSVLSLTYRTLSGVAGFVFAYCLAVSTELRKENQFSVISLGEIRFKHLYFPDFLLWIMIIWGFFFLTQIDYERSKMNWGFANYSYFLLMLFPILPHSKSRWLKRGATLMAIAVLLVSRKRTGIIALLICAIAATLLTLRNKKITQRKALIIVTFITIILYSLLFTDIAGKMYENFFYRFDSSDAEDLNGRTDIWIYGITRWLNGGPFVWLFGGNIQYRTNNGGSLTLHNDFIEMLVNYGLVGIVLLTSVFADIIRNIVAAKRLMLDIEFRSLIYTLVVMLALMLTSHIIIYPYMFFLMLLTVGYCYGMIDTTKIRNGEEEI